MSVERTFAAPIEWECSQVVLRLFLAMDEWRYSDVAGAFTVDGVWNRAGQALRGHDEIMRAMNERPRSRAVRHVVSNIVIDVHDAHGATGVAYITAYSGDAAAMPCEIHSPWLMLTATQRFANDGRAWKIAEQSMRREFTFAGERG